MTVATLNCSSLEKMMIVVLCTLMLPRNLPASFLSGITGGSLEIWANFSTTGVGVTSLLYTQLAAHTNIHICTYAGANLCSFMQAFHWLLKLQFEL